MNSIERVELAKKALADFKKTLEQSAVTALRSGVPLKNIIVQLDIKHHELLNVHATLEQERLDQEIAKGILPAHNIPDGLKINGS